MSRREKSFLSQFGAWCAKLPDDISKLVPETRGSSGCGEKLDPHSNFVQKEKGGKGIESSKDTAENTIASTRIEPSATIGRRSRKPKSCGQQGVGRS